MLLVAGKSVPSREPEIGSKQTIMCSNTVPPGFIWLVVVASIPTDREDPSGLAGWQSCKGLMAKEQLVVSLWIQPGNSGEELHCCCRNPSIHPQAWWHFLTAPATEHPLSVRFAFRRKLKFRCKIGLASLRIKRKSWRAQISQFSMGSNRA